MNDMTYEKLMQEYVNAPYENLLSVALAAINDVMPVFDQVADDGNGANIVLPFICVTLASDGKFTELEYRFIKDVTGLDKDYNEFKEVVQHFYTEEWMAAANNLIDQCNSEIKNRILTFCLAFAAVDETISREENAFIAVLMSDIY